MTIQSLKGGAMAKKILEFIIAIFICLAVLLAGLGVARRIMGRIIHGELSPKPSVYFLSTQRQVDFFENENWVLQYALDGKIENAIFGTHEELLEYRAYLEAISEALP